MSFILAKKTSLRVVHRMMSFCVLLMALVFASSLSAQTTEVPRKTPTGQEDETASVTWERRFIEGNMYISRWFDTAAEEIDLFIAGKKLTDRMNESSVRLENTTIYTEGRGVTNSPGAGVNLRLPNVEEYWQLKFTSYDENEERGVQQKGNLRQTPRTQNYGATLGLFKKLGDVRTSFQPRIELRDPLRVAHSITFESRAQANKFEVAPKLELFASPNIGTGFFHSLNFYFRLSKIYTLTLINEGEYDDRPHYYFTSNGFSIGQAITPRSALSYSFILSGNNLPNYHLEAYTAAITWSHLLYRKVLDYSITPHLDFARPAGFVGVSALNFTVTLNF